MKGVGEEGRKGGEERGERGQGKGKERGVRGEGGERGERREEEGSKIFNRKCIYSVNPKIFTI